MTIEENVEKIQGGKTNIIMDATVLSTLMTCPRKADFNFNHHLQPLGGKSNSMECGSIVHKFLEIYYKSIIAGVSKNEAKGFGFAAAEMYITGCIYCTDFKPYQCKECGGLGIIKPGERCAVCNGQGIITKPECGHPPNEYPGVHNTPKDSETNKTGWQHVLDTCDQYLEFWKNDHWVPLEVEVVKGFTIYEDDDIRIMWKAKLDWVGDTDQGIYPMDHKTMKQRRKTNSMNVQFMGQCLTMGTRNVFINKIGFQTTLKPEEKFIRDTMSYSAARLLEFQSETVPYWGKMMLMFAESEHFPPNFSNCEGKYGNCPFYEHVCSWDPSMREENLKQHFVVGPEWNPTNDEE
jgi:hypothetical protein